MKSSAARSKEADAGHCWDGFRPGDWTTSINVRDFIVRNVKPHLGMRTFSQVHRSAQKPFGQNCSPTSPTRKKGVLAVDVQTLSTCSPTSPAISIAKMKSSSAFRPTSRSSGRFSPTADCGWSRQASRPRDRTDPLVHEAFTKYRKSHNDGVFDAYTPEIMNCRRSGSSPDFRMPTDAVASSAITGGGALRRGPAA